MDIIEASIYNARMARLTPEVADKRLLPILNKFGRRVSPEALQRTQVLINEPYASATDAADRLGRQAAERVKGGRLPKSRLPKRQKRRIMAKHGL